VSQKPRTKTAVADLCTKRGVKDLLNKTIIDWKYEVLSKGDSATSSDLQFLKEFSQMDVEATRAIFNPFFQLECKRLMKYMLLWMFE
jgi:hypothetical protein